MRTLASKLMSVERMLNSAAKSISESIHVLNMKKLILVALLCLSCPLAKANNFKFGPKISIGDTKWMYAPSRLSVEAGVYGFYKLIPNWLDSETILQYHYDEGNYDLSKKSYREAFGTSESSGYVIKRRHTIDLYSLIKVGIWIQNFYLGICAGPSLSLLLHKPLGVEGEEYRFSFAWHLGPSIDFHLGPFGLEVNVSLHLSSDVSLGVYQKFCVSYDIGSLLWKN